MKFLRSLSPLRRGPGLLAGLVALALLAGCASALSRPAMQQVSPYATPAKVLEDPSRYIGYTILVAGHILRIENRQEGTLLEILGYPTTGQGYPDLSEPAVGRFLLLHPGYLDALIFQPGRQVAAAGRVTGQSPVAMGETTHSEPVLQSVELALLPERPSYYSPLHFGFGFTFGF